MIVSLTPIHGSSSDKRRSSEQSQFNKNKSQFNPVMQQGILTCRHRVGIFSLILLQEFCNNIFILMKFLKISRAYITKK